MEYQVYAKLVVTFESDKTPAQIRNALVNTNPTLRNSLKAAWRSQFLKDGTGGTVPVDWNFVVKVIDGDVDLDDGLGRVEAE